MTTRNVQAYYSVFSTDKRSWEQLGAVWSTAARMTSKVYCTTEAPDFLRLMDGSVAQLARKPVHARSVPNASPPPQTTLLPAGFGLPRKLVPPEPPSVACGEVGVRTL